MQMIRSSAKTARSILRCQLGQSAVEYLIVVGALVSALIVAPSAFHMVRDMMQSKYRSYSFGIAISDPPSSAFDEEVARDANTVKEVMNTLHTLENFIENPSLPDFEKPKWPAMTGK